MLYQQEFWAKHRSLWHPRPEMKVDWLSSVGYSVKDMQT